jgi:hypothetical protein
LRVWGLECALTMATAAGCCRPPPSTLYTFPLARAWLGVTSTSSSGASPTLTGFTPDVSDSGAQIFIKSAVSTVSPPGQKSESKAARQGSRCFANRAEQNRCHTRS